MPLEIDRPNGLRLVLNQELRAGLFPDLYPSLSPLWEDGLNVEFTDSGIEKIGSYHSVATTSSGEPIRGILQAFEDTSFVAYFGDLSNLYRVDLVSFEITELGSGFTTFENSGETIWDAGVTSWDGGSTIWDLGTLVPGHWSFVNYGNWIFATNGQDSPQVSTGGSFTNLYQGVVNATINSGGSGYALDDILTFTGGDGSGATCRVSTIASGAITGIEMVSGGTGYTTPPTGVSGGSGSGADIVGVITDLDVSTIKVFQTRGPHILGFNTSQSGREFIWCDADDPFTWKTQADNLAGALTIRELKTDIVSAVPLGNRIAVYGDDQMFLVNYLGNQLVFGYTAALNGVGAVSPRSVVSVGPLNYGLSSQGFFRTDGSTIDWIDRGRVRHWFENEVNQEQITKAVALHDEERRHIKWSLPTTSSTVVVIFNYDSNTWSFADDAFSAAEERTVWEKPITGTDSGEIRFVNEGVNQGASGYPAWVRTKPLDLENPDRVKELSAIRTGYRGTGLTYRVGWSDTEDGSVTWTAYSPVPQGYKFDPLRTAGRYVFLELYSDSVDADWTVMSIELHGRLEGTR